MAMIQSTSSPFYPIRMDFLQEDSSSYSSVYSCLSSFAIQPNHLKQHTANTEQKFLEEQAIKPSSIVCYASDPR